ncbi:dUTP diphosphatase [Candidatus Woesearchaeota archaeon CG10_big_fil_rev_8_21_14_0_10_34_8]|nr:MAG: dUTP diphosphatase [Candidatus Woesearchaeota archaeon CG10_big_fil_rev_8_21_14_0_10_34_8]
MTWGIKMKVEILKTEKDLPTPKYAHDGDAGMDVYSAIDHELQPRERKLIPAGFKMAVPYGFEVQVRPRSGLALKHGISVVNSPGTIDHQYRGDVGILLINHSNESFSIKRGDRIAQIVFNKVELVHFDEVESLSETTRGEGGFGSTGNK